MMTGEEVKEVSRTRQVAAQRSVVYLQRGISRARCTAHDGLQRCLQSLAGCAETSLGSSCSSAASCRTWPCIFQASRQPTPPYLEVVKWIQYGERIVRIAVENKQSTLYLHNLINAIACTSFIPQADVYLSIYLSILPPSFLLSPYLCMWHKVIHRHLLLEQLSQEILLSCRRGPSQPHRSGPFLCVHTWCRWHRLHGTSSIMQLIMK